MITKCGAIIEVDIKDWTQRLYPCPFCGESAKLMCNTETNEAFVECSICGGRSRNVCVDIHSTFGTNGRTYDPLVDITYDPLDKLLSIWNNRTSKL